MSERERLKQVVKTIAGASAATGAAAGGADGAAAPAGVDPSSQAEAEARVREQLEALHREKREITAEILEVLGLRTRAAWGDAVGSTERLAQQIPGPRASGGGGAGGGGAGMMGDVGLDRSFPPPDRAGALDHGARRYLEGAALPRLLPAGEAQAESRQSSPLPLLRPPTPPHQQHQQHQQQRRPPWQSIDLVHLARVAAGNADTAATPASSSSSSSAAAAAALDREPATSRYADTGGGAETDGYGRVLDYRDHRMASPAQSQWSLYPGAGLPLSGHSPWAEGARARDRRSSLGGGGSSSAQSCGREKQAGGGGRSAAAPPAPGWRLQSPGEASYHQHQHPSMSTPTRANRMRDPVGGGDGGGAAGMGGLPAPRPVDVRRGYPHGTTPSWAAAPPPRSASGGGERYRETGSLPATLAPLQGGGGYSGAPSSPPIQSRGPAGVDALLPSLATRDPPHWQLHNPSSSSTAEAATAMTRLSPSPSWDLGAGVRSGAEARPSQAGSGLASLGLEGGSRWPGVAGGRGGGAAAGAYAGGDNHEREMYRGDRLHRGSPLRDQYHPQDHQQQDHHSQLRSIFPHAGANPAAATPPRLGRRGSDPGVHGTGLRPLLSSHVSDSVRPQYPLPRLAEAVAAIGDGAAGLGRNFSLGDLGAGGGGGATDGGRRERRRPSDPTPSGGFGAGWASGKGCKEGGCDRRPIYAYKGSKKAAYCARHRLAGMIDTRHPLCKDERCTRQPSFGIEGDRRASYCAEHKKAGMINVSSRRCQQSGCLRHPNFGFPGDRRASYCSGHRETGMVDIVSRRCREPTCGRRPLYNMDGLRPVCCSQHKLPGMIDVVSTRCQQPGCFCHPSFGYASDKKARRCAKHRLEGMEGVKGHRQKRRREVTAAAAAAAAAGTTTTTTNSPSSPAPSPPAHPTTPAAGAAGNSGGGGGSTTRPAARAAAAPRALSAKGVAATAAAAAVSASAPTAGGGVFGGREGLGGVAATAAAGDAGASPLSSASGGSGGSRRSPASG